MRHILTILFLSLFVQKSIAQINPDWRQKDLELINGVTKLNKNNPKEVESFFCKICDKSLEIPLGFGWTKFEQPISAGYISISAEFYYYKDTIKTYILHARLPNQNEIIEEYKSLYSNFLQIDTNNIYFYKYKEQNILKPLKEFGEKENHLTISRNLSEYMAPTSGDRYGIAGGLPITTLQNRKLFNQIKDSLTLDQVVLMMYSINPVSRLTAIEYYMKNKTKFTKSIEIENWIEKVYKEIPTIETISGCLVGQESSRWLVEQFVRLNLE